MTSPHEILNPGTLPKPTGFAHAVVAATGRTVYLGGQAGLDEDGKLVSDDLVDQFSQAASNVVDALTAAGAAPDQLVSMQIFVTDVGEYKARLGDLAKAYQSYFGKHYPAIALLGVNELFEPAAKVELVCIAVIPD